MQTTHLEKFTLDESTESTTNDVWGLFNSSPWLVFILLNIMYAVCIWIQNEYILTDQVYYNSLGEQLTTERIKVYLDAQKNYMWIQYAAIPFGIVFQAFLITMCLNVGALLEDYKISFKQLFGLVIKAMIIFGISRILFVIFGLFTDVSTIDDIANINYMSVLTLIGPANVPKWATYAFSTLNVYELLFITLVVLGLKKMMPVPLENRISFVFLTYGTGLVCWVLLITYLMISIMPT
jgi:hypothetical protein